MSLQEWEGTEVQVRAQYIRYSENKILLEKVSIETDDQALDHIWVKIDHLKWRRRFKGQEKKHFSFQTTIKRTKRSNGVSYVFDKIHSIEVYSDEIKPLTAAIRRNPPRLKSSSVITKKICDFKDCLSEAFFR